MLADLNLDPVTLLRNERPLWVEANGIVASPGLWDITISTLVLRFLMLVDFTREVGYSCTRRQRQENETR